MPFFDGYSERLLYRWFSLDDTFLTRPVGKSKGRNAASYSLGKLSNEAFVGPSRELSQHDTRITKSMGTSGTEEVLLANFVE